MGDIDELTRRLVRLIEATNYPLEQPKGQRIYGPAEGMPEPPRGTEVFFSNVPRDCYEDELVPVFAKMGTIYNMRLMMDFSGSNRGYGFVKYTNSSDAMRAIGCLNGYQIRPGSHIVVRHSVDNRRLYLGDLPRHVTRSQVWKAVEAKAEGMVDITMYEDARNPAQNRGYCFVQFKSHHQASLARRALVGQLLVDKRAVTVDWAEPEPDVCEHILKQVRVLHVRHVGHVTLDVLRSAIVRATRVLPERVKIIEDFAFVHFRSREETEKGLHALHNMEVCGRRLEVTLARPPAKKSPQKSLDQQRYDTSTHYNTPPSQCHPMLSLYKSYERAFYDEHAPQPDDHQPARICISPGAPGAIQSASSLVTVPLSPISEAVRVNSVDLPQNENTEGAFVEDCNNNRPQPLTSDLVGSSLITPESIPEVSDGEVTARAKVAPNAMALVPVSSGHPVLPCQPEIMFAIVNDYQHLPRKLALICDQQGWGAPQYMEVAHGNLTACGLVLPAFGPPMLPPAQLRVLPAAYYVDASAARTAAAAEALNCIMVLSNQRAAAVPQVTYGRQIRQGGQ